MKILATIGTREPDAAQRRVVTSLVAMFSARAGTVVNTGAATGIDHIAMDATMEGHLHVFLPWATYNAAIIPAHAVRTIYDPTRHSDWTQSVRAHHPMASRLSRGAFMLHARNYGIVAPAGFVLACPNEKGEGGTGQGIRVARAFKTPVIQFNKGSIADPNAAIMEAWDKLNTWLKEG